MEKIIVIYADEGMVLTNGKTYGTMIFLAKNENEDDYHEITKVEYDNMLAVEESEAEYEESV